MQEEGYWTDELFAEYAGDIEGGYKDSVLAIQRAALWAALGEEKINKQAVIGSLSASGKPNKLSTTAEKLSACLGFVQGKWSRPIYLRVTRVTNPLPGAAKKTIPCVTQVFANEEEARAAAQADLS